MAMAIQMRSLSASRNDREASLGDADLLSRHGDKNADHDEGSHGVGRPGKAWAEADDAAYKAGQGCGGSVMFGPLVHCLLIPFRRCL